MRRMLLVSLLLLLTAQVVFGADAETLYKQGIEKLREAQSDHSALVGATKLLAEAARLYETAGDEQKLTEVNSCLYWAKKKFTLADASAMKSNTEIVKRLESAIKEVPVDQAQSYLEKADSYAKSHAEDPLLVAIRYFEVADRFKDSDAGRNAMDLSLKAMQRIGEKQKIEAYKPAPTDGKVFVKSEPAGAEIFLVTKDGGKLATGKVTPSLIQLPIGFQSVELNLKAFKPALLTIEVDGKTIAKPEAAKLEAITLAVDVVFEEGWQVFVNGKPARISGQGKAAETPCTIELPMGISQIGLAKEGFIDILQKIEVKSLEDKVIIEPKIRPSKGKSSLFGTTATGTVSAPGPVRKLNLLGMIDVARDTVRGTWKMEGAKLVCESGPCSAIQFPYKAPTEFDFRIVFIRQAGVGGVTQLFATDHPIMWSISCWTNQYHAFENCDGKEGNENATSVRTAPETITVNGKQSESLLKVRKDFIECFINGKLVQRWDKGLDRLKGDSRWTLNDSSLIGIGANNNKVEFLAVEINEISGPGIPIKKR